MKKKGEGDEKTNLVLPREFTIKTINYEKKNIFYVYFYNLNSILSVFKQLIFFYSLYF